MSDNFVTLRPLSHLDFGDGRIEFIETELDLSAPVDDQLDVLREDLLQVSYLGRYYLLDLGFYGQYPNGEFRVLVVKNYAWEAPVLERRSPEISAIEAAIAEAVQAIYEDREKVVSQEQEAP